MITFKPSYKLMIVALSVLLMLTSCAHYHQIAIERTKIIYDKQDYHSAFLHARNLARHGNPEAQYAVGYMYFYGQGIVEDHQAALHWIELSAHQGYAPAIQALTLLGQ